MLKALRKKEVAKRILYVLAGIIIIAFVFLGPGSAIRGRESVNFAGKIFGKTISLEQYRESLLAVKNQAIIKFGENFYQLQRFLNLEKEAWDRLILSYEAKRRKIKVSDSEVVDRIKKLPFLQINQTFDPKLYKNILDYIFKTPARDFEEQIRQSLMFEKLYAQVTDGVTVDEEDVLKNYKNENEKIKVAYISFLAKNFQDQVSADAEELKEYFQKHSSDFKRLPSVNVQYLGLDYPKEPTEEDREKIHQKITEIYSNLNKEKDIQKISKQFSLPIQETGFFSMDEPVPGLGIQSDFNQAAFNLKENQISEPVQTTKGIYILKLKEKKDSYIPAFEEAKVSVEKILKLQKATELANKKAQEYLAKLDEIYKKDSGNFSFKNTAESESLPYAQTPLFKQEEYIPEIGISKKFSEEAFSLKDQNKIFGFVSTEHGCYIMKLEEFVPIDEEKFVTEKEGFKDKLLQKKKDETFNNFFLGLKQKAGLVDNIPSLKSIQQ